MAYVKHEDLCGTFKGSFLLLSYASYSFSHIFLFMHLFIFSMTYHHVFLSFSFYFIGDTLLAIRAPIGTQLEVPIPESVSSVYIFSICVVDLLLLLCLLPQTELLFLCVFIKIMNGQRKYQIRLKSSSTPIEVLLVNKDPSGTAPVVLPVPPPEDILQNLPPPTPTSQPPITATTITAQVHV